jgi:hypothetical protein
MNQILFYIEITYSKVLGVRAGIAKVPSEKFIFSTSEIVSFELFDKGSDFPFVHALGLVVVDVAHWVFVHGLVELLDDLGVGETGGFSGESSELSIKLGLVEGTNISAGVAVALEVEVAFARLRSIGVVGAGSVGVARIGFGVADISVAANFVAEDTGGQRHDCNVTEVESSVASAREVISFVGAGGVGLAWREGAAIDEAFVSVAVEAIVASAALGAVNVVGAGGVNIAWVSGSADINVAGIFVAEVTGGAFDGVGSVVESFVASAREVISIVGAGGVSLARVGGARVEEALVSITVEAFVASAALGAVIVVGASGVNVAWVGGSADINVAGGGVGPGGTFT